MLFDFIYTQFLMLTKKNSVWLLSNRVLTLNMTLELIKKLSIPKTLTPLSDKLKSERPFVSIKNNAV